MLQTGCHSMLLKVCNSSLHASGEACSSWLIRVVLDFITGSTRQAAELRAQYIFVLLSMLNSDGVAVGNYRCELLLHCVCMSCVCSCSLAGLDLNRMYIKPMKKTMPVVTTFKRFLKHNPVSHTL